jgi:hypothetical protein
VCVRLWVTYFFYLLFLTSQSELGGVGSV